MTLLEIAKKKARQSQCRYKVSSIGLDKNGKVLGRGMNRPRFDRKGGNVHAEMDLMVRYGQKLSTIFICRVGGDGKLLPIDPCDTCSRKADELGIKIVSFKSGK